MRMPWAANAAAARSQESGAGGALLVVEDLRVGQPGVVVDHGVDERRSPHWPDGHGRGAGSSHARGRGVRPHRGSARASCRRRGPAPRVGCVRGGGSPGRWGGPARPAGAGGCGPARGRRWRLARPRGVRSGPGRACGHDAAGRSRPRPPPGHGGDGCGRRWAIVQAGLASVRQRPTSGRHRCGRHPVRWRHGRAGGQPRSAGTTGVFPPASGGRSRGPLGPPGR